MKKGLHMLIIMSLIFSLYVPNVNAETVKKGVVSSSNGYGVTLRSGPGTSHKDVGTLPEGKEVVIDGIITTNDGTSSCASREWYKLAYYNGTSSYAYACTSFIKLIEVVVDNEFEKQILPFPESYKDQLRTLHALYPNAKFVPYETDLKWNDVLYNESNEMANGKSLFWDSSGSLDGWKHFPSYSFNSNSFYNGYDSNPNFYAASQKVVAFYLDPRNFLNADSVFMFQSSLYDSDGAYTISGIEGLLKGSFMSDTYVDGKTEYKFSEVIMQAANVHKVSPYYIASRILQETGTTRSSLVKGNYPDYPAYNGYYNFFNYGAYKTNSGSSTYNGLVAAHKYGWNSEYNSIVGGVERIANTYVKYGQDTGYFEKWNVVCNVSKTSPNPCYTYQYMTNIQAPNSEALETAKAYKKSLGNDMYKLPFIFKIPIYKEMVGQAPTPDSRSPINYLNSLTVNGNMIANFNGLTTEYNLTIPSYINSINVQAGAIAANKGATVSGVGNINITGKKQDVKITVTAANGNKLDYVIHVTRLNEGESVMNLEDTIKNIKSGFFQDSFISGLTNVDSINNAIKQSNGNANIKIADLKNNVITTGNIGTGYKVSVTVGSENKNFETVIYGDTNGDTEITILDLLRVQKQLLNSANISGAYLKACDVSKDGNLTILDLLKLQKHLLGTSLINQ